MLGQNHTLLCFLCVLDLCYNGFVDREMPSANEIGKMRLNAGLAFEGKAEGQKKDIIRSAIALSNFCMWD